MFSFLSTSSSAVCSNFDAMMDLIIDYFGDSHSVVSYTNDVNGYTYDQYGNRDFYIEGIYAEDAGGYTLTYYYTGTNGVTSSTILDSDNPTFDWSSENIYKII